MDPKPPQNPILTKFKKNPIFTKIAKNRRAAAPAGGLLNNFPIADRCLSTYPFDRTDVRLSSDIPSRGLRASKSNAA
mgnify:CR=1 FL=1